MRLSSVTALLFVLLAAAGGAMGYDGPVVVDYANFLDGNQLLALTHAVQAANAENDFLLVILTVPSLDGQRSDLYTKLVMRSWGIHRVGRDDGLLLLVVKDEMTGYFRAGKDAERALGEGLLDHVRDGILAPRLRNGKYLEAFLETVRGLGREEKKSPLHLLWMAIPAAPVLVFVYANTLNRRRRVCLHCGKRVSAVVSRCPHCVGDLRVSPTEQCPCGSKKAYIDCCLDEHTEGRESHRIQFLRILDIRYLMSRSTGFGGYTGGGPGETPPGKAGDKSFDGTSVDRRF